MKYNTKLVGVTFANRQKNIERSQDIINSKCELYWHNDVLNQYDANAVEVYADKSMTSSLGHLSRISAEKFMNRVRKGETMKIFAEQTTGGAPPKSFGVNVLIMSDVDGKSTN